MKDICVDKEGNLRCNKCGGKNFHGRRTARAHVIGYATVGIGALATQKKLRCQACGTYNKQGNAKPWRGDSQSGGGVTTSSPAGIDASGKIHCWYCGYVFDNPEDSRGLHRCGRCGHPNEMTNPDPWKGPVSSKWN